MACTKFDDTFRNKKNLFQIIFVTFLMNLVEGLPKHRFSQTNSCVDPSDAFLQSEFNKFNNGLDVRTLFLESYDVDKDVGVQFDAMLRMNHIANPTGSCDHIRRGRNLPLKQRALCPWTVAENKTSDGTFPRKLFWAKPHGQNCIGMDHSFGCERVHVKIFVLKRSSVCTDQGVFIYNKEVFNLPIASVCAKGREFENSHKSTDSDLSGFSLPEPVRK